MRETRSGGITMNTLASVGPEDKDTTRLRQNLRRAFRLLVAFLL